jgi:hypothetical protein
MELILVWNSATFICRNDEAEELWEENLRVEERTLGPNDPKLVVHLQNLATAYAAVQKYEKCEPLLRRSLKLVSTHLGPNAPQISIPLACLATALHHLGKQSEAEPLARQAQHIREAAFGPDSLIVGKPSIFFFPLRRLSIQTGWLVDILSRAMCLFCSSNLHEFLQGRHAIA